MNKPRPLTELEICGGKIPGWSNDYALWMASLASFSSPALARAHMGRIRAIRALENTVKKMLPLWKDSERENIVYGIRDMAKLIARAEAHKRGEMYPL